LDLRKYGTFPHSGFGLGIERTVAWICGRKHIREASPFPRLLNRLYPSPAHAGRSLVAGRRPFLAALAVVPQRVPRFERHLAESNAALAGELLEPFEAGRELRVGALHGVERMGTRESGEIDDGEEEVSELLLEGGRRLRLEGAPDLLDLFRDLFERPAPIRPVEADGADPLDRKSTRLNSSHVKISYA